VNTCSQDASSLTILALGSPPQKWMIELANITVSGGEVRFISRIA